MYVYIYMYNKYIYIYIYILTINRKYEQIYILETLVFFLKIVLRRLWIQAAYSIEVEVAVFELYTSSDDRP